MTEKQASAKEQASSPYDWMKMFTQFWSPFIDTMSGGGAPPKPAEPPESQGRFDERVQTSMKMWQAMSKSMTSPLALETFQAATRTTPDMLFGFTQTCLNSFMTFQTEMIDWFTKTGKSVTPKDFQQLDKEMLHRWTDTYQKEFSQYLNIPQIGLGRFYQEKALQAVDKSNVFQAAVSEFLHVLYLPIEKSFQIMQQKISDMTDKGELGEDPKVYYRLWIQVLEGCYMELFKQPEFPDALRKTIEALNGFYRARQDVINDMLRSLSVPTQDDLDELYKEIHALKRRFRNNKKNTSRSR
jgi:class III poly(R)-hydroxyalkanoic acid synthase PhaE subunit